MANRVVLAYSGGLDTSVAVRWMIEHLGVEVVCLSADVGQEGTLEGNREKALGAGAIAYEELDLRAEFADEVALRRLAGRPQPAGSSRFQRDRCFGIAVDAHLRRVRALAIACCRFPIDLPRSRRRCSVW